MRKTRFDETCIFEISIKMWFFWCNYCYKILFFRVSITIDPGRSLLQFVTTNYLISHGIMPANIQFEFIGFLEFSWKFFLNLVVILGYTWKKYRLWMIARPNPGIRIKGLVPSPSSKKSFSNTKRRLKYITCEIQRFTYKTFYGLGRGMCGSIFPWMYHGEEYFYERGAGYSGII